MLLAIPLFFLNVHEGHSWGGDDYALYIKEAENISKGIPFYKTGFVFYTRNICFSPPQYPPGFPLLLAPIVKIWGLSIKPMCYFNTVLLLGLMLTLMAWFRKQMGVVSAICLALLIGYSGIMVDIKQCIWSDLPCLLFVMLYLLFRRSEVFKPSRIALLIILSTMAVMIRTQAILLVGAEVLLLIYHAGRALYLRKPINKAILLPGAYIALGMPVLLYVVNRFIFYTPLSAGGFYLNYLKDVSHTGILEICRNNVNFLVQTIYGFFYYETDSGFRTVMVSIMQSAGLICTLIGFAISVRRGLKIEDLFFCLMIGLMLYYPIHDSRYFLPAIAIVYYYCYLALQKILPALTSIPTRKIGIAITVVCLVTGFKYLKSTTNPPIGYVPAAKDYQAFRYIQDHVGDSELVLFSRPRFLTLYTNKRCMVQAWLLPMEENHKLFDSMHVKYALTVKGLADGFNNHYLAEVQHPIDSVIIAEGYTLYRMR